MSTSMPPSGSQADDNELLISQLPPLQAKLLRYILGQHTVKLADLRRDILRIIGINLSPQELDQWLEELLVKKQLTRTEENGHILYSQPLRRKGASQSMRSVWAVLEDKGGDDGGLDSDINPLSRRTRSNLTDSVLADLSSISTTPTPPASTDSTPSSMANSLMADLFSTGRSSMQKRATSEPKSESEKPKDDLLSDLLAIGRKKMGDSSS